VLATAQLGAVSGGWDSQSEVFHAVVDDRALLRLGPAECAPAAAMDPLVIAPAVPTADLPRFCVEASWRRRIGLRWRESGRRRGENRGNLHDGGASRIAAAMGVTS
jgi:hypothetical protein